MTTELMRRDPDQRSSFINDRSYVWGDLKDTLQEISNQKCWYCEAEAIRFHFHVDHYRPKNRVEKEDGTTIDGYWWLSFDYKNFRVACSLCNSLFEGPDGIVRGKSDHFPLQSEAQRATSPQADIRNEVPLLLDPTNKGDCSLLWFLEDGRTYPKDSRGFGHKKAKVSIKILNLNDPKVTDYRKRLWIHCNFLIDIGNDVRSRDPNRFKEIAGKIYDLVQPTSAFSSAARAFFRGSGIDWVRKIVQ